MITNVSPTPTNTYIDSFNTVNHDGDTTETMTVLGSQLTNPYLLPNMQQAYAALGITNVSVTVTNNYIRFLPTIAQLSYLDSFMDAQGLELMDAPLDYQILLEGDYYQDPSIPDSVPTWQYAVVPVGFTYPAGIQYQLLAQIHIPGDSYTAVETEAELLASSGGGGNTANANGGVQPNGLDCGAGYHYDYDTHTCVANTDCPTGYYWNGNACVVDPPPPPNPPAPAPDAAVPAGGITVDETQPLAGLVQSSTPGVKYYRAPIRKALVVARRWFKIERVYTDDNGKFQFTKHFKHKVRINIKFKNDDAIVRGMRNLRLWQMLFPLKKTVGVYSSNKTGIDYNFQKYDNSVHAKGTRYWAGATVHNAVQEYKGYATSEGIGQPAAKVRILVTDEAGYGAGSTPMYNKRALDDLPLDFAILYIGNTIGGVGGLSLGSVAVVLKHEVDIAISFNGPSGGYANFKSDDLKTSIYHELTHAGHYNIMKGSWYNQFVNAEIAEIIKNFNSTYSPYGYGTDSNAPIIALGESWAYYMGHYMADLRYGALGSCQKEQQGGDSYGPTCDISSTGHSHIDVLEFFDPNLASDPFHWIPKGLYEDLIDATNETFPVTDNVSGYYTESKDV